MTSSYDDGIRTDGILEMFVFTNARTSISALVDALRAHSDKTALAVLAGLIEAEAHRPNFVMNSEKKQVFLDLWAALVFEVGARTRKGKAQRLFVAAAKAEIDANPERAHLQRIAREMYEQTTHLRLQSLANVEGMLDFSFGTGAFDHTKHTAVQPGVELVSCLSFADYACERFNF